MERLGSYVTWGYEFMVGAERGGRGMAETNIPKKKNQGHHPKRTAWK